MKHPFGTDRDGRIICVLLIVTAALGLACLSLAVGYLFIHAPAAPADTPTTESDTADGMWVDVAPSVDMTLPLTEDAGIAYQDSLTFVGDSLTAHLINRGVLTYGQATEQVWKAMNSGGALNLNSEVTSAKVVVLPEGHQLTIAEAAGQEKPSILIVTLGTDWGVAYLTEEDFKAYYTALVEAIQTASPDTAVILQSIFPVTAECKILSNDKINVANKWVKAVAADTGCPYLDTQSVLKDENGCLKAEYCNAADGIHLTAEAYEVILAYIRTHAYIK